MLSGFMVGREIRTCLQVFLCFVAARMGCNEAVFSVLRKCRQAVGSGWPSCRDMLPQAYLPLQLSCAFGIALDTIGDVGSDLKGPKTYVCRG